MSAITTEERIIAPDGTPLACRRSGAGPPLLLVHGTGADHARWADLLPALQGRFTVYALDRRGRGGSGDAAAYASEREFEDVAAVVDAIGAPACVLGHSFGALCTLEAARRTRNIRKLVLYEPPMPLPPGTPLASREVIAVLRTRLAAGDRDGALDPFYREVARIAPEDIALLRASPAWPARVAAAHTILRELQGVEDYVFDPERFKGVRTPTLLLLGGDSPPSCGRRPRPSTRRCPTAGLSSCRGSSTSR